MASMAKALFGAPVKSVSCFSSGGLSQDRQSPRGKPDAVARRWSSDEQHRHRVVQSDERRRGSLYAQQKAERAMMREHFRQKYNLPRSAEDQRQMKEAGREVRLPRPLRAVTRQEEAEEEEFSFMRLISYKKLEEGGGAAMQALQRGARCLVM